MEVQNEAGTSGAKEIDYFDKINKRPIKFYPEGHPMNDLQQLNDDLFGHLKTDVLPVTKRRKILRRLERRKEKVLSQTKQVIPTLPTTHHPTVPRKGSLWDLKEKPLHSNKEKQTKVIGPQQQTMYTIKDNKIVRLKPVDNNGESSTNEEYQAVNIVSPVNPAERELLEGTKMSIDDIRSIERFKDYEPGVPSKVLYVKNISPSVTREQLSLLFNQFHLQNGGKVDVRLLAGRMRGQAFVSFNSEELAIQALEELNGTILSGKPLIVQFGRNSNRILDDNDNT